MISNDSAVIPPKVTFEAVPKLIPLIVTTSPACPFSGEKDKTLGHSDTVTGVEGSYGFAPKPSVLHAEANKHKHASGKKTFTIDFIAINIIGY